MRDYAIFDVFTEEKLGGNPLAVIRNSEGLSGEMMQKIAGEFNLSETIFILPPEDKNNTARVRIFTPKSELPFAGHPTVGVACDLASRGEGTKSGEVREIRLEERAGLVVCEARQEQGLWSARFRAPKAPQEQAANLDNQLAASILGLDPADIGMSGFEISSFDAAVPFTFIPVTDLQALGKISINTGIWPEETLDVVAFTLAPGESMTFRTRMFAPSMGIAEDPATGAASVAFSGVLAKFMKLADGEHQAVCHQGYEMGRPSKLELSFEVQNGQVSQVKLAGAAVMLAEGKLYL